jgi:endonuclease/exonuclease/phosphatase family metal-dependent hydrolase
MIVTILQWNIWYQEDIRNIAKFLHEHPADIICLQELTRGFQQIEPDTVAYIAKSLGYHYYDQEIHHEDETWSQANGIFTKFPIINTRTVWINEPTGTGTFNDEPRAYIEATLQVGDKQLIVGTTHMSYTKAFESTPRKEQEADKLTNALRGNKQNFILTGDLNAEPESPTIQKISQALKHVGSDMHEPTWTTKPFSYEGFEADELKYRLDYVFATPDMRVVSSKILKTEYSDHLPVRAEIQL